VGAFRLPKDDEEQKKARIAAIQVATLNAAHVPLHTVKSALRVMELALRCVEVGNLNAISDAASGLMMARAGLTAAAYNVRININSLPEPAAGQAFLDELKELENRAELAEKSLRRIMNDRGGIQ
jgi:glutamate formiminotransferase/formiminotetrahydrofolate cyclodeaminase